MPSPDLTVIGANVLRLVSTWPTWVKRRVETIDFIDEVTISRSVRVDLDLSAHLADDLRVDWKGLLLVPVATLRRQPHATFVIDEQGATLLWLNKFEERNLCYAAMLGWAEQLALRKLRASFLSAALITAVLLTATVMLTLSHLENRLTGPEASPAALTLLLMLPVAGAAYLSKPANHRLTARILFNVRVSVVVAARWPF